MTKRCIYNILLAFGLSISVCAGSQAIVVQDSLIVTDVTPVQFCVVWTTSEPATGTVMVFENQEGTIPYPDPDGVIRIKFKSAEHPPAEDIGVMKVSVTGLKPDTLYFFQTETTAKNDNVVFLSSIESVRTEKESIPVRNDVIAMKVTIGQTKPAPGMLVVASIDDKASHPVTGWVGDGVAAEWVLIDTNNFYLKAGTFFGQNGEDLGGQNLQVEGEEQIRLLLVGGLKGSVETLDTLLNPKDTSGVQPLKVAASLPDSGSGSTSETDTGSGSTPNPGTEPGNPISPDSGGGGGGGAGCFIASAGLGFETDFTVSAVYALLVIFGIALLRLGFHIRKPLHKSPL